VTIAERVQSVMERMERACRRAGRDPSAVRLVAVSKMHPPEAIREAYEAGLRVFGESRVQEAMAKIPMCPGDISWHMIGHLQRNKAKQAVECFEVIHSADSQRLLETLDRMAQETGRRPRVFLEVNVSGERSKFGLAPEAVPAVLEAAAQWRHLNVVGLMTMPPFFEDPEKTRPFFRRLRELRDEWRAQTGFPLDELSMGMTHDFEIAIEEGATWVRVGTALFGERRKAGALGEESHENKIGE
jgi:pyridoxal phosphate enzyme (YggS family)